MRAFTGGLRVFFVIWAGQLLSLLGSGLTGFALGVWVFQRTGSATQFAVIALAATLPAVLVSPLAGALVDRWDRRRVLIVSDAFAALATLVVALLYLMNQLEVWHILLVSALGSTAGAFQGPAYTASVTLLVPKEHFGRASGMAQMARAISQVLSPVLAGLLLLAVGMAGVIFIDFATFLFAVGTLLLVRIPRPAPSEAGERAPKGLWREALQGWTYIRDRAGLLGMLLLFAALNFILGMVAALGTPMLLSFTSPDRLGIILSVGGIGMLLGSLVMSTWGGPRRLIHAVLGFLVVIGLGLMIVGLRPSALWAGTGFFIAMAAAPMVGGCAQAIWQRKVPADLQGRVFATRGMVALAATPLAYLLSGPLADRLFNPWLAEGGLLAERLGPIVGVGPGRGIGLMFVIAGLLVALASLSGYLIPSLRRVEEELPDAAQVETAATIADSGAEAPGTPPAPVPTMKS